MEFEVETRSESGKSINRTLRSEGRNSGIIYGLKDPLMVSMPSNKALKLITDTHGRPARLTLNVKDRDGNTESKSVILQDFQLSPYKRQILHVDFREVNDESQLKVTVPINIVGVSKAVKLGGVMQVIRREIPIRCAAKNLPEQIDVNVNDLDFGGSIHVLDIPYPEGVKPVVSGRNFTLITLAGRQKEVEEETSAAESEETSA